YHPVTTCTNTLAAARQWYPGYWLRLEKVKQATNDPDREKAVAEADRYLKSQILARLQQAMKDDPLAVRPILEFAPWFEEQLKLLSLPEDRRLQRWIDKARALDPEGKESYLVEYRVRTQFAQRSVINRKEQYQQAAQSLRQVVDRDPTDARLRYQ